MNNLTSYLLFKLELEIMPKTEGVFETSRPGLLPPSWRYDSEFLQWLQYIDLAFTFQYFPIKWPIILKGALIYTRKILVLFRSSS